MRRNVAVALRSHRWQRQSVDPRSGRPKRRPLNKSPPAFGCQCWVLLSHAAIPLSAEIVRAPTPSRSCKGRVLAWRARQAAATVPPLGRKQSTIRSRRARTSVLRWCEESAAMSSIVCAWCVTAARILWGVVAKSQLEKMENIRRIFPIVHNAGDA